MKQVIVFEAKDGKRFDHLADASDWEAQLDRVVAANAALDSGATLDKVLDIAGVRCIDDDRAVLALVTKDTKLAIPHWQCRDEPGYQPIRIEDDCRIMVWGDAGSWTGAYGSPCYVRDVARYARETFAKNAAVTRPGNREAVER